MLLERISPKEYFAKSPLSDNMEGRGKRVAEGPRPRLLHTRRSPASKWGGGGAYVEASERGAEAAGAANSIISRGCMLPQPLRRPPPPPPPPPPHTPRHQHSIRPVSHAPSLSGSMPVSPLFLISPPAFGTLVNSGRARGTRAACGSDLGRTSISMSMDDTCKG